MPAVSSSTHSHASQRPRTLWMDILRIFAMSAVIIIHVSGGNINQVTIGGSAHILFNALDSMSRWSVDVFFMISGALFLSPTYKTTWKRLLTTNIPRLLIAFLSWNLLYFCYNLLLGAVTFKDFFTSLFTGYYHMWFLPMLIQVYLFIIPLRYAHSRYPRISPLVITTLLSIPLALSTLKLFIPLPDVFLINFLSYKLFGYLAVFYLGHLITRISLRPVVRYGLYVLACVSLFVVVYRTHRDSVAQGITVTDFYSNLAFFTIIPACAVFIATKYLCSLPAVNDFIVHHKKIILTLSSASFGVYLVHPFFLSIAYKCAGISSILPSVRLGLPLTITVVMVCSFISGVMLKRIPIINKWCV